MTFIVCFLESVSYPCPFSSCNLSPVGLSSSRFLCLWIYLAIWFSGCISDILLMNVCSIRVVVLVTLHVSEPYSSSLFTLVLKILILFRVEKDDMFHTVFKMLNSCLAFLILFLTSSYVPPLSVTTLPRQVNVLSSSISFPFSCTLACCILFTFSSFVFCMFIFKPVFSASFVNLLDFFCICLCECDSRQVSSAKSRSSNCLVNVHWMPFWPCV